MPEETNRINEGTRGPENTVYIGKKPTMNYVLAVVTQFNSGMPEVTIKARGNAISRAVDVKEIVLNRFLPNVKEKAIKTSSEELVNEDGTRSKVSAIQITLIK
ncbi:MAG: DNA-binding protein Alba [Candidatus Marsarchaeota archaeon]|nr:DNA-binding protein Alba [Candidatus Marsarchaeota archaeon]